LVTLNAIVPDGQGIYVSGKRRRRRGSNSQYGSLEGIPTDLLGGIDVIKNPEAS